MEGQFYRRVFPAVSRKHRPPPELTLYRYCNAPFSKHCPYLDTRAASRWQSHSLRTCHRGHRSINIARLRIKDDNRATNTQKPLAGHADPLRRSSARCRVGAASVGYSSIKTRRAYGAADGFSFLFTVCGAFCLTQTQNGLHQPACASARKTSSDAAFTAHPSFASA